MKKNYTLQAFLILGIIIVAAILYQYNKKDETSLKVHYYVNGKEVNKGLFSMVGNTYYNQIKIDVIITAFQSNFTNLRINNASPLVFKNSLPTTVKTIPYGQRTILWSSSLINTSLLETYPQPIRFYVNVSGTAVATGGAYSASAYVDLNISKSVKMRFDSLTRTGAIAFADTCGQELTKYNYMSSTSCLGSPYTGDACPAAGVIISGFSLLLDHSTILTPPRWAQPYACIYQNTSSNNNMAVAWRVRANAGQDCIMTNAWMLYTYNKDSNAAISSTPRSVDPSLEVYC